MRNGYLDEVVRRASELNRLEEAALRFPAKSSAVRWAVAAACGLLAALLPAAGTAQAFFQMI